MYSHAIKIIIISNNSFLKYFNPQSLCVYNEPNFLPWDFETLSIPILYFYIHLCGYGYICMFLYVQLFIHMAHVSTCKPDSTSDTVLEES